MNIVEPEDNDTVAENATGGWLIEKDNYNDTPQFRMRHTRYTIKSPEEPSPMQMDYIQGFFTDMFAELDKEDKRDRGWENYVDIDALARYYMVNEMCDDVESFTGSCYMYKERGDSAKLIFGPVWDFGLALERDGFNYFYNNAPGYCNNYILLDFLNFPHLHLVIRHIWTDEIGQVRQGLCDTLLSWALQLKDAGVANHNRWPERWTNRVDTLAPQFLDKLNARLDWLDDMWNMNKLHDINNDHSTDVDDINELINRVLGVDASDPVKYVDVNFDASVDIDDVNAVNNNILNGN